MDVSMEAERPVPAVHDGLPTPERYWAMAVIALGTTMAVLDGAIVNIALPTIARAFGASPASSIWVVNGYQLAVTISLLPLSSLGDRIGYRRIYWAGLLVFTLASLGCALADSLWSLTVARTLQGFGAAGIMSVGAAMVRFIYPRRMLGRGIGVNTLAVATSAAIGPTIAAGILSVASWPWLFAVNVPFGTVALIAGLRLLPVTPRLGDRFDWPSAILTALAFSLLITGIDGFGHGERAYLVLGQLGAAAVIGAVLVHRQLTLASPVLPVDLLRIPIFALSIGTSICSFTGQMLAFVSLPFHLQEAMGRSAVETGLLMTPWPLAVGVAAPIAGRLADRYPAGLLGAIGLSLLASGLISLALMPADPHAADVMWRMALCGVGFGIFQSPNNRTILLSAPRERSGGASGMLGTARLLGQSMGAALAAVIFHQATGPAAPVALAIGAGFALVAAVLSALRLKARRADKPVPPVKE